MKDISPHLVVADKIITATYEFEQGHITYLKYLEVMRDIVLAAISQELKRRIKL